MSCPSCYNTACPEIIAEVNINQTILQLADGDAVVDLYSAAAVSGTELTLPNTPITGYTVKVFVNGVLQQETTHYTISGAVITFTFALTADDVQVAYAYEV